MKWTQCDLNYRACVGTDLLITYLSTRRHAVATTESHDLQYDKVSSFRRKALYMEQLVFEQYLAKITFMWTWRRTLNDEASPILNGQCTSLD